MSKSRLLLEDGTTLEGDAFGAERGAAGEVVFNTGMVGYPEALTDPSYHGQILVFTQPMIGNYGVPAYASDAFGLPSGFESERIHAAGAVVADLSGGRRHRTAARSFSDWLRSEGVPGLSGVDTRALTQVLRERGTMLGAIARPGSPRPRLRDPNLENLVAEVSVREPRLHESGPRTVVLLDCGAKANIVRSLLLRGVSVLRVPWDFDYLPELDRKADGPVLSNGPGDPKRVGPAIERLRAAFGLGKPILGICLGNQLMALAAGFDTYKLKYGHRSQNQPCVEEETGRCLITSQNHGFAVDPKTRPRGWEVWFTNANDGTVEGIRHSRRPFRAVQFHPEATPGPVDAGYLFDEFVKELS
ncbi:MAG: glutamine-hydrolyzing carbamoyl-phosphate synthase small subunit [Planctomycetes bacterium]|nr:glutamine-hydrolyzing carbamoyl-phosphate synthase small subunit [Planctomycetota bacterium]